MNDRETARGREERERDSRVRKDKTNQTRNEEDYLSGSRRRDADRIDRKYVWNLASVIFCHYDRHANVMDTKDQSLTETTIPDSAFIQPPRVFATVSTAG